MDDGDLFEEDRTGDLVEELEADVAEEEKAQKRKRKRDNKMRSGAARRQQQIIKKNFNDLMHPRNNYKVKPHDFNVLARKYPSFQQFVHENRYGNPTIDWKDPFAVRELTYVLLQDDYNLKLDIPIDQLCPTVPNRANYILWLADLLKESGNPPTSVRGIDIGTGASCIYPLLGVAINGWDFVATDIDDTSLEYARKNIELNKLEHKIELRDAKRSKDEKEGEKETMDSEQKKKETKPEKKKDNVLLGIVKEGETFAFCMCNPPFFEDISKAGQNPKTVCTGTMGEMVTKGGELGFVKRIIADSLFLKDRIRWYTTLLGRKADVNEVMKMLGEFNIVNVRTTTFYQGKTARWGVAWSFTQDGLQELVKATRAKRRRTLQELSITIPTNNPSRIIHDLKELFVLLDIRIVQDHGNPFLLHCRVLSCKWREEEEERQMQEEREKEDKAREEENVSQLVNLQNCIQQYQAVEAALEADPDNEELKSAKQELGEVIALADSVLQGAEESNNKVQQRREAEDEARELDKERKAREVRRLEADGEALLEFDVVVYQAQSLSYAVEFSLKDGSEQILYELFDYVKPKIVS